jgi:hypothetical protein
LHSSEYSLGLSTQGYEISRACRTRGKFEKYIKTFGTKNWKERALGKLGIDERTYLNAKSSCREEEYEVVQWIHPRIGPSRVPL